MSRPPRRCACSTEQEVGDQARSRPALTSVRSPVGPGEIGAHSIEWIKSDVRLGEGPQHDMRVVERSRKFRPDNRANDELTDCCRGA